MFSKSIKVFLIVLALFFIWIPATKAATLYMDPVRKSVGSGEVFEVKVKIGVNRGEECINVAKVGLGFSPESLKVEAFDSGDSFFSLWINKPNSDDIDRINKTGTIYFSGGIPGGYCGKIPGDSGDSNVIGTIIFSVKDSGSFRKTSINFLTDTKVFLHDGAGSLADIKTQNTAIEIDNKKVKNNNLWVDKKKADVIPPESFVIEINKTPNAFDNKYFIMFSTVDKQTGIDHYEIMEDSSVNVAKANKKDGLVVAKMKKLLGIKRKTLKWKKVKSPYLLKDQDLNSVIIVKAIDNAGNETVAEYRNDALTNSRKFVGNYLFIFIGGGLIFFIVVVLLFVFLKKKRGDDDF